MEEPRGYYVYAYLDGNTPFYIGKGHGDRAQRHLTRKYLRAHSTFFYRKLNKMLREGRLPEIIIIKDGLSEKTAYDVEGDLISLVGTRAHGTGPLCNIYADRRGGLSGYTIERGLKKGTVVQIWGEVFPSATAASRDPRCEVSAAALLSRLERDVPLERAVKKQRIPPPKRCAPNAKSIICWDQEFLSIRALSKDDRCIVRACTLSARLQEGWPPEEAAECARKTPRSASHRGKPTTCWDQEFPSIVAIAKDPRCIITGPQLQRRLFVGWDVERAATIPIDEKSVRYT